MWDSRPRTGRTLRMGRTGGTGRTLRMRRTGGTGEHYKRQERYEWGECYKRAEHYKRRECDEWGERAEQGERYKRGECYEWGECYEQGEHAEQGEHHKRVEAEWHMGSSHVFPLWIGILISLRLLLQRKLPESSPSPCAAIFVRQLSMACAVGGSGMSKCIPIGRVAMYHAATRLATNDVEGTQAIAGTKQEREGCAGTSAKRDDSTGLRSYLNDEERVLRQELLKLKWRQRLPFQDSVQTVETGLEAANDTVSEVVAATRDVGVTGHDVTPHLYPHFCTLGNFNARSIRSSRLRLGRRIQAVTGHVRGIGDVTSFEGLVNVKRHKKTYHTKEDVECNGIRATHQREIQTPLDDDNGEGRTMD
ncbi:hypothetical protein BDN72DRAFT_864876 [Pluteus cervinus]|uniref:Uncharacterized protein n=1 Tax=Pluteus cervinus TaxID=181527 RepID=A0ACD3A2G3_9AGAR|nr:hypothetical protein BDN72DRAFT_864876 [Pluteus cervinus]